ncbi:MAG TPA: hypothetical protein VGU74_17385 [Gemmatimonadales bacterium]|nr:hypothetical protein [Gemmatimonadales bacterium]
MIHGAVFVQFVKEFSQRGNYQLGSVNWIMGDASRTLGGGTLRLRVMASAEYFTLTKAGYPQLLQVAEPYNGGTLTDRMHPHELVSEAAALYERPLTGGVRWAAYIAAAGEPALGPVAYLHRPSAENDPTAPLGHHSQDVTHESFGVVTLGLFSHSVHLEASAFNGNLPDEVRTNFDFAPLSSYSARLTVNPSDRWSLSGSAAHLAEGTGTHAHGALHRFGFSAMHIVPRAGGAWSTSLVWGANVPDASQQVLNTALIETNIDLDERNAVFGRAEYVTRTAEELALVGSVSETVPIGNIALGYARRIGTVRTVGVWLGARGNVDILPEELRLFYGSRTPGGFTVYARLKAPTVMPMNEH